MKKLFFIVSIAAALVLTGCNHKKGFQGISSNEDPAAQAVMDAVEECDTLQSVLMEQIEAQDIKGLTQAIGEAQMRITELADSGEVEIARVYAMKLHQVIKDNAEAIKQFAIDDATLNQIVVRISNMPLNATDDAATIVKALGAAAKEGAKQAAETTIRRTATRPAPPAPATPNVTQPSPAAQPAPAPAKPAPATKPAAPAQNNNTVKPAPVRKSKDDGGEVRL